MKLKDRFAIVTGGAKGIGREIATVFAEQGADIGIIDTDEKSMKDAAGQLKAMGRNVITSAADISDRKQVDAFVQEAVKKFGKIDILVNCAAYIVYKFFLEFDEATFRRMIDVDVTGYFNCSQSVAQEMVKTKKGKIINIASIAAGFGVYRGAAYVTSKAGIVGLMKVMALELAPYGINVNAVSPGVIETEQMKTLLTEDEIKGREYANALGRLGKPRDIANAVLFLVSDDADYITGTNLHVDGGLHALRKTG